MSSRDLIPATRLNLPLKYLTPAAIPSPLRIRYRLNGTRISDWASSPGRRPGWCPSHITTSACSSSGDGCYTRLTPVEIRPWMASTFPAGSNAEAARSYPSDLSLPRSPARTFLPAMPPSLFIRSVAHCTARMPHSPAVPAAPDRGAMIPIRSGLFCAKAGANSRRRRGGEETRTRKSGKIATRELHRCLPLMLRICRALLAYHKYITDISSSDFFGKSHAGRSESPFPG